MNRISKRAPLALLFAAAVVVLFAIGLGLWGIAGAQALFQRERPTVVPAEALTPAPTPADDRQIAILNLVVVAAQGGKVESVRLERAQIVGGYAPNVFGLSGPWAVELVGKETIRFGTLDPRQVRVYDGDEGGKDVPHTTSFAHETTWELVVPLHRDGQDLGVREINIYDERGRLIFSTPVEREKWLSAGEQR